MFQIGKTIVSEEILQNDFVCNLNACKGACCVEGDLGAPLDKDELPAMEEIVELVKPYLSNEALDALEKEGPYLLDEEGDFSTTTVNGRECAFAFYDDRGILKCGIEKAWQEGKTDFRKPISCHLYPIRLSKLNGGYVGLNYSRWSICSPACSLGQELGVPLYEFLKEPLIRKFGQDWYNELLDKIDETEKTDKA